MTRISPADQLAAIMRAQIASLRGKGTAGKAGRTAPPKPNQKAAKESDLAALTAERIRAIPVDDPQRKQKALRAFLECVVLSELGQHLVNDPAFVRMIDHVQERMQADPELARASDEAAEALLKTG